jgi:Uncharacterized protein conserved in bacteria (DUF2188)
MPKGDIETFYEDGEWRNRVEDEGGLRGTYDGKEEAISEGRRMAQTQSRTHHQEARRHHRRTQQLRPRLPQCARLIGRCHAAPWET